MSDSGTADLFCEVCGVWNETYLCSAGQHMFRAFCKGACLPAILHRQVSGVQGFACVATVRLPGALICTGDVGLWAAGVCPFRLAICGWVLAPHAGLWGPCAQGLYAVGVDVSASINRIDAAATARVSLTWGVSCWP